jgi:hypothetical protein
MLITSFDACSTGSNRGTALFLGRTSGDAGRPVFAVQAKLGAKASDAEVGGSADFDTPRPQRTCKTARTKIANVSAQGRVLEQRTLRGANVFSLREECFRPFRAA